MKTTELHLQKLKTIIKELLPWQEKFTTETDQLKHIKNLFSEKVNRFAEAEQTLNIAIMGQVKAGKSSFLNALLFNGKAVLPEAATPKTASLTRISYAETPRLEVDFYSTADWDSLFALAKSEATHQLAKSAREQVAMVEEAGINALETLQTGTFIQEAQSLDDIMNILNDYAGNDGKYTALVKMIRLYLPLEELQGYNVVDTPGMNDPVVSRTQRTKEEMASSDVVFFLSRASNFLDATDTDLLSNQLPEAGIKRLVLTACQYDSAIEQDGFDRSDLAETEKNLQKRIGQRAEKELTQLADQKEKAGNEKIANLLRTMTKPIFSSTFAYGFINWDKSQWNDNMQRAYDSLCEMAEDEWNDYQFTDADWQRLAGFEPLQEAYESARADKAKIIAEQKNGLLPEAEQNLSNWLTNFKEHLHQRIITLETGDMATLDKKQTQYINQINRISDKLEDVIGQSVADAKNSQREISAELKRAIQEHSQLQTRTGTETHEESYTVSTSRWYNPFSWGSSETRYRTVSVNYEYVSVADVVDQITSYAYSCQSDIEYNFAKLINPNYIKTKLKKTLLDVLNTDSPDFEPTQFRNLLNQVISGLDIPTLSLDIGDAGSMVSRQFSGEIRNDSDKAALKHQLNQALSNVFEELNTEFKRGVDDVILSLETTQNKLADELSKNISVELEQLRQDLDNQAEVLASYQELEQKVIAFETV